MSADDALALALRLAPAEPWEVLRWLASLPQGWPLEVLR